VNRTLDNILISVATIGVLLFLKHFLQAQILTYSLIMLGVGLAILIFGERILDGEPSKIKSFFINIIGITMVVGGANFIMEHFTASYWWIYGIVGLFLFEAHHYISERF
jgi:hypothetical protein